MQDCPEDPTESQPTTAGLGTPLNQNLNKIVQMTFPTSQRTSCPPHAGAEVESFTAAAHQQSQTTLKLTRDVAEVLCPAIGKLIEEEVRSL